MTKEWRITLVIGLLVCGISFWATLHFLEGNVSNTKTADLNGKDWCIGDSTRLRAEISQSGNNLEFRNESGGSSKGHFENAHTVVADDWGKLRGVLSANGLTIAWANNIVWKRCPK